MDFCDFLAEDALVEIIPNVKYPKQLNLISGDFGPFTPSIPVRVPMWLALNLHRQHKCTIIAPNWSTALVQQAESANESNDTNLSAMPSKCWRETLKLLEQIHNLGNCSQLVERREAILRKSVHDLFRHTSQAHNLFIGDVKIDNVSRAELHLVRTIIQMSFKQLQELRYAVARSR